MSRWLSPWGLREAPFSKEIGDADLWIPSSRASAVERLVETCHDHGHALLVGEPPASSLADAYSSVPNSPDATASAHVCTSV